MKPLDYIRNYAMKLGKKTEKAKEDSWPITDKAVIDAFISKPENVFLVSFPRTGSHWLRMMMELYFGRPSLTRAFYYPDRKDYLTFHTHDLELDVKRENVIYLYRDPVETIFSQLGYHGEDKSDTERIRYWSDFYGRHLEKWLHRDDFTNKKTVLRYDRLKSDLPGQFAKICDHLGEAFEQGKLDYASTKVTRSHVKERTRHDPKVVSVEVGYDDDRERFRRDHASFIWAVLTGNGRDFLLDDFSKP